MDMLKIGILGLTGVMLAIQFKGTRAEISLYMGVALCILIFAFSMEKIGSILSQILSLKKYIGGSEAWLSLILKAVGITYIGDFCASVCKDAGYQAVAGQIEIFAKLSVLCFSLPVMAAVVENISTIVGG